MFEKLAKFRPFEPRRTAPWSIQAPQANDNLPGFRHPEGRRRRPIPAPVCHWSLIDGRLECRWSVENRDETAIDDLDQQQIAVRHAGPRSVTMRPAALKMPASA
jgi:hypothetical protein